MKTLMTPVLLLALCIGTLPYSTTSAFASLKNDLGTLFASERLEEWNMNQDWFFFRGEDAQGGARNHPETDYVPVTIPHTLRLEKKHAGNASQVYQGIGWYRRSIKLDEGMKGKKLFIDFEGVMTDSEVYFNGEKVAERHGGYVGFTLDITNLYRWGEENVLALKVSSKDSPNTPPGKPLANLDFHYYGGIYRDVRLRVASPLHITDELHARKVGSGGIFVQSRNVSKDAAELVVQTHIQNDGVTAKAMLKTMLVDAQGVIVAESSSPLTEWKSGEDREITQTIELKSPKLWHPYNPHLYTLVTELYDGENLIDKKRSKVGVRDIAFKPDGFYINGEKFYLRGANRHQSYPFVGDAASNSMQYRDALQMKQNGFNTIRATHYPQDPEFLKACDELGLLVIVCQPGWQNFTNTETFYNNTLRDAQELIRRDRNHPSVILWEISLNETGYPEKWVQEVLGLAKKEFPSLPDKDTVSSQFYYAADYGNNGKYYNACYKVVDNNNGLEKDFDPQMPFLTREWGDWGHQSLRYEGYAPMLNQVLQRQRQLNGLGYTDWGGLDACKRIAGYCLWSWNDYPRGSQPVTLGSGAVDADRYEKLSAHWLLSMQSAETPGYGPMVYIAHEHRADSPKEVHVFSNCESVTLSRNGKEMKTLTREEAGKSLPHIMGKGGSPIFVFTLPDFEEGTLEATATYKGKTVKHKVMTPGEPVAVTIEPALRGIAPVADGSDLIPVYVKVVDKNGTVVPTYEGKVTMKVTGEGTLVGEDIPRIQAKTQTMEGGVGFVFVKTSQIPGNITISANSGDLKTVPVTVMTQKPHGRFLPSVNEGKPRSLALKTEAQWELAPGEYLNLAYKKPVMASSEQTSAHKLAVNLVDENDQTFWCADGGAFPQWVQLDLEKAEDVAAVELRWERQSPYTYTIETSLNGVDWVPLSDEPLKGGDVQSHIVNKKARYLKVTVLDQKDGWACMKELLVRPYPEGEELLPGPIIPDDQAVSIKTDKAPVPERGTDKLRDGVTTIGTGWLSQSDETPQSLVLELKSPHKLSGHRIHWEKDSAQYTYTLEVSEDGQSWTPIMKDYTVMGQFYKPEFFLKPMNNIRFIKLTLTDVNSGAGLSKVGLAEWTLYGTPQDKKE